MAGLTVAEKKDWKERLSKRIDRPIEVITAEDPQLLDRVRGEARQRALESLGLADNQRELDDIRKQREKLDEREEELKNQLLARVKVVHPNEVGSTSGNACAREAVKQFTPTRWAARMGATPKSTRPFVPASKLTKNNS